MGRKRQKRKDKGKDAYKMKKKKHLSVGSGFSIHLSLWHTLRLYLPQGFYQVTSSVHSCCCPCEHPQDHSSFQGNGIGCSFHVPIKQTSCISATNAVHTRNCRRPNMFPPKSNLFSLSTVLHAKPLGTYRHYKHSVNSRKA